MVVVVKVVVTVSNLQSYSFLQIETMKKKIFYGICMMGLVALVATSCKKKEESANSFSATHGAFEAVSIDDDRAYLDPETKLTIWDEEDQIKVFNFEKGREAIFQVENAGANTCRFVNQGEDIGYASGYYAFYPAEMAADTFDGVYQKFVLDPVQYVRSFSDDGYSYGMQTVSIPQAAYTTYQENHYYFKIIFGIARFNMTCAPKDGKTRYVQKIVVRDNHFNLCGEVTLKPNKIDQGKLSELMTYLKAANDEQYAIKWNEYVLSHEGDGLGYSARGGGKELIYDFTSLNNLGHGVGLNNVDVRSMMVGLRPGALAYGFYLDVYVYDNYDGQVKKITIDKYANEKRAYAMEPAKIKTFNIGSITELVNAWPNQPN